MANDDIHSYVSLSSKQVAQDMDKSTQLHLQAAYYNILQKWLEDNKEDSALSKTETIICLVSAE